MEPITAASRPPSPLAGLADLVSIMGCLLVLLVIPLAMFEVGRELSRYAPPHHIAIAMAGGSLLLSLLRPCRCAWLRR